MKTIIFLDEETTGKLHPDHRIIELSMREWSLTPRIEKHNHILRFNPERNIDAKAFAVHGISRDELEDKPTIADSFPAIIEILGRADLIVAHNGLWFDKPFLEQEAERCGFKIPEVEWFDTMVKGTFATDFGKNPTLREYCWALGVEYDERLAHKGDYDTDVMAQAFFAALDQSWIVL